MTNNNLFVYLTRTKSYNIQQSSFNIVLFYCRITVPGTKLYQLLFSMNNKIKMLIIKYCTCLLLFGLGLSQLTHADMVFNCYILFCLVMKFKIIIL